MRGNRWGLLVVAFVLMWRVGLSAQERPTAVEERLIRLEEGQLALGQRFDDLRADVNRRFDDVNRRFDDVNRRFDDLRFWLQAIFGVLVLVISGLIAQWLTMWQRLIRVDTTLSDHLRETEKDQLIAMQRQEIAAIRDRVDRLESSRP